MQQPPNQPTNYNEILVALAPMTKQLDRLELRVQDVVTRSDLESLRRELVARDSLEPQLNALRAQINRIDADRQEDRKALEKRLEGLENEQISRTDRLWMRFGQIGAFIALLIAVFDFLSHLKITP